MYFLQIIQFYSTNSFSCSFSFPLASLSRNHLLFYSFSLSSHLSSVCIIGSWCGICLCLHLLYFLCESVLEYVNTYASVLCQLFIAVCYHRLSASNNINLLFNSFCGSGVETWLSWVLCLGSQGYSQHVVWGCCLILNLAGKGSTSKILWLLEEIHFLQD